MISSLAFERGQITRPPKVTVLRGKPDCCVEQNHPPLFCWWDGTLEPSSCWS